MVLSIRNMSHEQVLPRLVIQLSFFTSFLEMFLVGIILTFDTVLFSEASIKMLHTNPFALTSNNT